MHVLFFSGRTGRHSTLDSLSNDVATIQETSPRSGQNWSPATTKSPLSAHASQWDFNITINNEGPSRRYGFIGGMSSDKKDITGWEKRKKKLRA